MGDWGCSAFENDNALDWAQKLTVQGLPLLYTSLGKVLSVGPRRLPVRASQEALAACEVIACLKGQYGRRSTYTEDVGKWVEQNECNIPFELVQKAVAAIDRILAGPSSIHNGWRSDHYRLAWTGNIRHLRERLLT